MVRFLKALSSVLSASAASAAILAGLMVVASTPANASPSPTPTPIRLCPLDPSDPYGEKGSYPYCPTSCGTGSCFPNPRSFQCEC